MIGLTSVITAVIAFAVAAALGFFLIPFLRKVKYGQTINDVGPTWHAKKQGTPTMGGFMMIAGVVVAAVAGYLILYVSNPSSADFTPVQAARFFAGLFMALAFAFVGFVDDYIKVVKKRNLGLKARQKLIMQFLIATAYIATLVLCGDTSTIVVFPMIGQVDFSFFYYPLIIVGIVGFVNAVNLTDGIDGLASSVTFVVAIVFMVISSYLRFDGISVLSTALAGACLGFLVWNFYPAKCFMGDLGSMFLGGMVVALGMGVGLPILLIPIGIVYILEELSVVIQVTSFKLTGKRVFKMSPIHHHFEMCGWSEVKIVLVFSLTALVFGALAVFFVFQI
ncbi:MAG: phospho-N-acetylmuramoyl-pentapeptide-transferase [Oscillospiraceae bacterium]|jgi:phospho-N-acetylmuramoyl-pentapeptide-transferase